MSWIHNSGSNCRNISLVAVVQTTEAVIVWLLGPAIAKLYLSAEWDFPDITVFYHISGQASFSYSFLFSEMINLEEIQGLGGN
jgi:hypothetical protein